MGAYPASGLSGSLLAGLISPPRQIIQCSVVKIGQLDQLVQGNHPLIQFVHPIGNLGTMEYIGHLLLRKIVDFPQIAQPPGPGSKALIFLRLLQTGKSVILLPPPVLWSAH